MSFSILYCDSSTNQILKTVPFDSNYIPVKHKSIYVVSRGIRAWETDIVENPLNYIWYNHMGPLKSSLPLSTEQESFYKSLVNKINHAEYLWNSYKSFVFNIYQQIYADHVTEEIFEYEKVSNLQIEKESLTNKFCTQTGIDLEAFTELQKLNKEFIIRKKRELYISILESQDRIMECSVPEEQILIEIRRIFYTW
jgi:hypothetical protein